MLMIKKTTAFINIMHSIALCVGIAISIFLALIDNKIYEYFVLVIVSYTFHGWGLVLVPSTVSIIASTITNKERQKWLTVNLISLAVTAFFVLCFYLFFNWYSK